MFFELLDWNDQCNLIFLGYQEVTHLKIFTKKQLSCLWRLLNLNLSQIWQLPAVIPILFDIFVWIESMIIVFINLESMNSLSLINIHVLTVHYSAFHFTSANMLMLLKLKR